MGSKQLEEKQWERILQLNFVDVIEIFKIRRDSSIHLLTRNMTWNMKDPIKLASGRFSRGNTLLMRENVVRKVLNDNVTVYRYD